MDIHMELLVEFRRIAHNIPERQKVKSILRRRKEV